MRQAWTVRYTGNPALARFVVQTLEEHGLQVRWDPPTEDRSGVVQEAAIQIFANGTTVAMTAAARALWKHHGRGGRVQIEPPVEDAKAEEDNESTANT